MTVIKFGGSCLKDEKSLQKVGHIVRKIKDPIIVVSAISGVTDSLISHIKNGNDDLSDIMEKHRISLHGELMHSYNEELEERLSVLKALFAIHKKGMAPEFISSHIQSYGERLSALMLSFYLRSIGIEAVTMESEDIGIMTKRGFNNAIIDDEKSIQKVRERINSVIKNGKIPVITGYFGNDSLGHVTLLGRNGSDYTAAFIARAVGDKEIILYKDVPGFFTADPKKVDNPEFVPSISFDQAFELSSYGAKIVHPYAILEAKKSGSSIVIRDFSSDKVGTVISNDGGNEVFVTSKQNLALVRVVIPNASNNSGILYEILRSLSDHGINIIQNFTSYSGLTMIISQDSLKNLEFALEPLYKDIELEVFKENISVISVVGDFENDEQMYIQQRLLSLKDRYGKKIHLVGISSPGVSLFLACDDDSELELVNQVHEMVKNAVQ